VQQAVEKIEDGYEQRHRGHIAGQIGLGGPLPEGQVPDMLTGRELAALSDAELIDADADTEVFARVTLEQKLRLVLALQARGEVVFVAFYGVAPRCGCRGCAILQIIKEWFGAAAAVIDQYIEPT